MINHEHEHQSWRSPIMLLDFLVWGNLHLGDLLVTAQGSATLMDLQRSHHWQILYHLKSWVSNSITYKGQEGNTIQCVCMGAKLCPTLCDPMDCSPPGASVHGIFQVRILGGGDGLPFPPPWNLPNPGIEPGLLVSPAMVSGFFTTDLEVRKLI